jgi:hypothetical protein
MADRPSFGRKVWAQANSPLPWHHGKVAGFVVRTEAAEEIEGGIQDLGIAAEAV